MLPSNKGIAFKIELNRTNFRIGVHLLIARRRGEASPLTETVLVALNVPVAPPSSTPVGPPMLPFPLPSPVPPSPAPSRILPFPPVPSQPVELSLVPAAYRTSCAWQPTLDAPVALTALRLQYPFEK